MRTLSRRLFVQILPKPGKDLPNVFRPAQIVHRIRNRVVIFQSQQRRQLVLIELLHPLQEGRHFSRFR
jgi:hypothetical protein